MPLINLSEQQVKDLMNLLGRADIKGNEASVVVQLLIVLQKSLQPQVEKKEDNKNK